MERIAVLGAGESGVGTALLAMKNGYEVFVSDYGEIPGKYKEELKINNIPFEEKGHSFEILEKANLIVKSPGIPERSEVVRHFRLRGKKIISEIEWASRFFGGRIIGITGSNGKTTTTSMIYHLLSEEIPGVGMGGNIGTSMARLLCGDEKFEILVLELSSFQLDDIEDIRFDIGVILNITADHLDRYDYNIEKYADAKWNLALSVKAAGDLVINGDDPMITKRLSTVPANVSVHKLSANFPMTSLPSKDGDLLFEMNLKGRHNLFNANIAAKVAELMDVDNSVIIDRLKSFDAIEHRLESIGIFDGVEYINDSKATNVESSVYALEAMNKPVIWIAGGTDKGNDYSSLVPVAGNKVKAMICLCVDDTKLRSSFESVVDKMATTRDMKEAILLSRKWAEDEDVVLLSPACASFDLFDNYEHRGREFKNVVLNIKSETRK
ncbi:MAG: UDP-N-acetylmuramoyl-L-alanine--D-glutamate ligase [Saprospiraceae bacterium]|nr:UDP-N-acetylmuramoyl-L-alanine--D-glutamate ligase [Bacteroidia bacterium]MBT8229498.1 UDP-N-acetylmuramoyl-L-alanine--D-glutamate ligase [Bacteroidia bacterium]NNF21473.1 UDP-N-acetylmuramoyl-L-alanine--D-glutamate ligase [Saprospiraceae bacterium]NNK90084.1 UDP-N-acetylmuramoyl-L-alanine--D-glutamate ligase [Saprospiraceae bacterium]